MKSNESLEDVLSEYMTRADVGLSDLARLAGLPKQTIENWRTGQTKRSTQWQPIVKIACALSLNRPETDRLLAASKHPPTNVLEGKVEQPLDIQILDDWRQQIKSAATILPVPPKIATWRESNPIQIGQSYIGNASTSLTNSATYSDAVKRYCAHILNDPRLQQYRIERRFVRMRVLLDQGEQEEVRRWVDDGDATDLPEIIDQLHRANIDAAALVVLGEPGAGKSMLLRHLQTVQARHQLETPQPTIEHIPFFVTLNNYRADSPPPLDWLREQWREEVHELPHTLTNLRLDVFWRGTGE